MPRRIVSLWLPRLAAERMARRAGGIDAPFAVAAEEKGALSLISLNRAAEDAGLARLMALTDARAVRPDLLTRPAEPQRRRRFPRLAGPHGPPASVPGWRWTRPNPEPARWRWTPPAAPISSAAKKQCWPR